MVCVFLSSVTAIIRRCPSVFFVILLVTECESVAETLIGVYHRRHASLNKKAPLPTRSSTLSGPLKEH